MTDSCRCCRRCWLTSGKQYIKEEKEVSEVLNEVVAMKMQLENYLELAKSEAEAETKRLMEDFPTEEIERESMEEGEEESVEEKKEKKRLGLFPATMHTLKFFSSDGGVNQDSKPSKPRYAPISQRAPPPVLGFEVKNNNTVDGRQKYFAPRIVVMEVVEVRVDSANRSETLLGLKEEDVLYYGTRHLWYFFFLSLKPCCYD